MPDRSPTDQGQSALARDVSFLGSVLGDVLREQGGEELFDAVEGLRLACRRRRQGDGELGGVQGRVDALPWPLAGDVVRAFTIYFHLINMAEESHRLRRLDERESANWPGPRDESIGSALARFAEAEMPAHEVEALLAGLSVRPVITAHPTEARRMTLLRQLRRISELVNAITSSAIPPVARERCIAGLYAEVTDLWQTNELRLRRQTVLDEVQNGLYYLAGSIFDSVARMYRDLDDALQRSYPALAGRPWDILSFGSWIGGDRDGNPNVTAEITAETLRLQQEAVLARYLEATERLHDHITVSTALAGASSDLLASIERDAMLLGGEDEERTDEPYRRKIGLMIGRLRATLASVRDPASPARYAGAGEFLADLELIAAGLRANRGERIAAAGLLDLIRQVRTFGFHLARLDIRQHRDRHLAALDELLAPELDGTAVSGLDAEQRTALLERLLADPPPLPADLSADTAGVLAVFRTIAAAQARLGRDAVDTYIVSMTADAGDLLAVLLLARLAAFTEEGGQPAVLRVVPLFETEADLEHAPGVLRRLWSSPAYAGQFRAFGRTQEVMLGYSDSDKDAGYFSANWHLYRAQQTLMALADEHGMELTFFHGRGGAIGRGGGPLARAIAAQPAGTVRGRLKVTEQGEVLFTRYANPGIAHRHLEQVLSAVLLASSSLATPAAVSWEERAAQLSAHAGRAYRAIVSDDPDFLQFFDEGTPLRSIMRLRIASRPARRQEGTLRLEDLRAIPWVFAWTQARWGLPGWLGLGTALTGAIEAGRVEELQRMYRDWPFFRWTIDAAQISLGKADLAIASLYADLVTESGARRYGGALRTAHRECIEAVCRVVGQERLLDSWPVLQRSIALRNPYVDPMSFIQVRAIRAVRAEQDEETIARLRAIIDRSVTGIAAGLQNTG